VIQFGVPLLKIHQTRIASVFGVVSKSLAIRAMMDSALLAVSEEVWQNTWLLVAIKGRSRNDREPLTLQTFTVLHTDTYGLYTIIDALSQASKCQLFPQGLACIFVRQALLALKI
jgi:hypothetical protein